MKLLICLEMASIMKLAASFFGKNTSKESKNKG
jgi:hypothetical protein